MDMDSHGFFYLHAPYPGGPVFKYAPNGEALGQIDPGPSQTVTIDLSNDDVYVDDGNRVNRYTQDGQLLETFGEAAGAYAGFGSSRGLGVNATSHEVYVANNNGSHSVDRFTTTAAGSYVVADATAIAPTAITRDGATLRGVVNPSGVAITSCKFEYGPNYKYAAGSVPCAEGQSFSGSADQSVSSAPLTGLASGAPYHYRVVVQNSNGKTTVSTDRTFSTQGAVKDILTEPATAVTRTGATLNGSFDTEALATNYYFEYGTTTDYTDKVPLPAPPGEAVGAPGPYEAHQAIAGLAVATEYHYRIVAENSFGKSVGEDVSFETPPAVAGVSTDPASGLATESASLNGSFVGDGLDVETFFEWGGTTSYGSTTAAQALVAPNGPTTVPAQPIAGLQPLHTYHFRFAVKNSTGTTYGADRTFTTFSAPGIVAISADHVSGSSADLHAVVNPHGAETQYHFEYGPSPSYGTSMPIPDGTIPSGEEDVALEAHLTGLDGGTYHFRIVASSIYGTTTSGDQTFNFFPPTCPNSTVRQQTGSNNLPDCRAYELVSPEDAGITLVFPSMAPYSPTAISPSRLSFIGAYGLVEGVGEPANNVGDAYVATRTNEGWKTRYVGIPSSQALMSGGPPWDYGGYLQNYIGAYEPDKWNGNVVTDPTMARLVDWNDGYRAGDEYFESPSHPGSSNAPYVWDTTSGRQLDRWPTNVGSIPGGTAFKGRTFVSPDTNHFVFTSDIAFAVGGKPGDMYDNDTRANTVKIINFNEAGGRIAATPVETSTDGSHILMTVGGDKTPGHFALTGGPGELFMRVGDQTFDIAAGHAVEYIDMTPDGGKVYITSNADLTADGSDTDSSRDLYRWSEESSSPNHLTLVSQGNDASAGNSDSCNASWTEQCGVVPVTFTDNQTGGSTAAQAGLGGSPYSDNAIAANNGDIYFLSPELLAGANGVSGLQNLYDYRNGKLQFVAALDPAGVTCVRDQGSIFCSVTAVGRMQITPNDERMAFLTASKVGGYDNAGHSEMYVYTPASGDLTCVSCLPSGEPPSADVTTSHNGKFLTDDGRPFFETDDALVPPDTNEGRDVYEYVGGRPQLITSGTAASNEVSGISTNLAAPGLVGVSANGLDVYFATYDVLVGQDRNGEALKIYDARTNGGFLFNPPVPPCVAADECHGPSTSDSLTTPSGTGANLGEAGMLKTKQKAKKKSKHRKKAQTKHKKRKKQKRQQKRPSQGKKGKVSHG